jgi:hypothetical protein
MCQIKQMGQQASWLFNHSVAAVQDYQYYTKITQAWC